MVLSAYAKINLFLDITGRRENGYHEILSLMHTVSLADTVSLEKTEGGISLFSDVNSIPTDERNLAYRAAKIFFSATGIIGGVRIGLEKRIPVSAGLAGGSTDAAAVFVGLNRLYGSPLSVDGLCALGKTLGADIPFCIKGGSCEVRGIGEILLPAPAMPDCYLVVAKGGEGVSTPAAYRALDEKYDGFIPNGPYLPNLGRFEALKNALEKGSVNALLPHLYNLFEEVILPSHSHAAEIKRILSDNGALATLMSGSGPSVFGIFDSETKAEAAKNILLARTDTAAFVTCPISPRT